MADKKTVFVSDLTHEYFKDGHRVIALNGMPYPVSGLVTYAKANLKNSENFDFKIFKYPTKLIDAILARPPDIACFSNYMWNFDLDYSVADRIKKINPKTIIIFGGPNYPTDASEQGAFLKHYNLIDFHVYKEGEVAFNELIQTLEENDFDVEAVKTLKPKSCHFIQDGIFAEGEIVNRVKNLDDIPSPYLTGELDEFFDRNLLPMIQCNRGCPFYCTFCVEGLTYYNKVNRRSAETIFKELCYIAEHKDDSVHDLHIVDSNFGMYQQDETIADAIAEVQEKYNWPEHIHVATGKNQKERVLKVAKTIRGALRLSGAVQTLSENVLENIKRSNIDEKQLMELAQKAKELGGNVYSEIILGLPAETKKTHFKTIETIVNAKFNFVRMYPLMMLPGVEMSNLATREKWEMKTGFRVMSQCFGVYPFGKDEPILSAEIEEICTSTSSLSFEDYLDSRLLHLLVEIFHNDNILGELLEFLNLFGVPPFDILRRVYENSGTFPKKLKNICDLFLKETREELAASKEELEKYAKTENAIREYSLGKHGSNMIYRYKAMAFADALDEVIKFAYKIAARILKEKDPKTLKKYKEYLKELEQYSVLKKNDFLKCDGAFENVFHYNFCALEERGFKILPDEFSKPNGIAIHFAHTEDQKKIIGDNLQRYGSDSIGISRILSKFNVTKMYRITTRKP